MKKLIIFTLTLMLVFSMTIPAFAATPKLEIPKIPTAPTIKVEVKLGSWANHFAKNPINIGPLYPK
jgi:hypothetical protein